MQAADKACLSVFFAVVAIRASLVARDATRRVVQVDRKLTLRPILLRGLGPAQVFRKLGEGGCLVVVQTGGQAEMKCEDALRVV